MGQVYDFEGKEEKPKALKNKRPDDAGRSLKSFGKDLFFANGRFEDDLIVIGKLNHIHSGFQ